MLNKSRVRTFLCTALFLTVAGFASYAAPTNNVAPAGEPAVALDHAQAAPLLSCSQVVCDTTAADCTPQGCGTCHRRAGEIFGHCSDIPQ